MPKGTFAILLPLDADYKVLGYYFADKRINFEITSDLFLRINLNHEKSEFFHLKLNDISFISYLYKLKGKIARKASGLILGLILDDDDEPNKFQTSLKSSTTILENIDLLNISQADFEGKLKEIFEDQVETITEAIDPDALKINIINRTKEMLSGSKKDRLKAKEILDLMKQDKHLEIIEYYKQAELGLKGEDYSKAAKFFKKSADIAEELLEKELAKTLKDKASLSGKIPTDSKDLVKTVTLARNYLKSEKFNKAYLEYKRAADIAKALMMPDKSEEYTLKSKALQDFFQVDQRFKKKK